MCGIVGVYNEHGKVDQDELDRAIVLLLHRGPDGHHKWVSERQNVALGHSRLSIVGVRNGDQPLFSSDHSIVAVVNGEFYDYKLIKNNLAKKGYKFSTESDSEIIIALYQEYGLTLFDHLNGEFSFILYDKNKNLVLAARDRFGIKPLFYYFQNNRLIISSEIKPIMAFNIEREFNYNSLNNFFYIVPSSEDSCFKKIHQVKPGCYIKYEANKLISEKYWEMTFSDGGDTKYSDNELIEIFQSTLRQAVKRRMEADVPVGCYLSGGIDSTSILALAAEYNPDITAFTIEFDKEEYNEGPFARNSCEEMNVNLSTIKITEQDITDNFINAIVNREAPIYQTCGIAKYILSKHVQDSGCKVVMTGEGADEMLLGYQYYKEDIIEAENKLSLEKLRQENQKTSAAYVSSGSYPSLEKIKTILGHTPAAWKLGYDLGMLVKNHTSTAFQRHSTADPLFNCAQKYSIAVNKISNPANKAVFLWLKTFFPENILSFLGDRSEMAHSIEGRLPFLDSDVVELCSRLPTHMKLNGTCEKYILREAIKGLIPDEIYKRQKHIFAAPPVSLALNNKGYLAFASDTVASEKFKNLGIFDVKSIMGLISSMKKKNARDFMIAEFALNLILSTYYLHEKIVMAG